eukprot:TRINITY_DN623_c1_g1_i2.p1 TRINITY_DN623_c1_g1~~TRINITY_DN623_c1_g1_i2.p1  ORF type:complete len:399 (-),score=57.04 TRINITY_DN623_c1_g1_i2:301-1443(-)
MVVVSLCLSPADPSGCCHKRGAPLVISASNFASCSRTVCQGNMLSRLALLALCAIGAVFLSACGAAARATSATMDACLPLASVDGAQAFSSALRKYFGSEDAWPQELRSAVFEGGVVLAPTEAAIASFEGALDDATDREAFVQKVFLAHVAPHGSDDVYVSAAGSSFRIDEGARVVNGGDARIVQRSSICRGGSVFVVDEVIVPRTIDISKLWTNFEIPSQLRTLQQANGKAKGKCKTLKDAGEEQPELTAFLDTLEDCLGGPTELTVDVRASARSYGVLAPNMKALGIYRNPLYTEGDFVNPVAKGLPFRKSCIGALMNHITVQAPDGSVVAMSGKKIGLTGPKGNPSAASEGNKKGNVGKSMGLCNGAQAAVVDTLFD